MTALPVHPLPHKPLPPRIKVSYARAMTVCIAAICRDGDDKPLIVLCSDSRIDYGDQGSTNTAVKLDIFGSWVVRANGGGLEQCRSLEG